MAHTSTGNTQVMIHSVKRTMLVMRKRVLIIPIAINVTVRVSSTQGYFEVQTLVGHPNKSAFKHNMKLICLYTEHNLDQSECHDFTGLIYSGCQARVYHRYSLYHRSTRKDDKIELLCTLRKEFCDIGWGKALAKCKITA